MAKLILDDFTGGLAPKYWRNTQRTRIIPDNTIVGGTQNPLVYPGYLVPGSNTATTATNVDQLTNGTRAVGFIPVDDNNIDTAIGTSVYFGQAAKIHAYDILCTQNSERNVLVFLPTANLNGVKNIWNCCCCFIIMYAI